VNGGQPGGRSTKELVGRDGTRRLLPSKCDRIKVQEGDILYFNTWGGGGWGDPLKRPPEKVAQDVARGLVSREGAAAYGVVLDAQDGVDAAATEALRRQIAAERAPQTSLFNRGGTIDELKARCQAETGFEPPRTPVFANWMRHQKT
jgi:N-methylhydantoinase B